MSDHTLGESHWLHLDDGRKLHYRVRGSGGPTVVFETGMGFSSAVWGLVQPEVARYTTCVVYDRAGAGKSDWDTAPRTLDRICDDLEQLLQQFPGPLILVGHSWGGAIIRRIAARGSTDIRGLVLVDQSDERNNEYFTKAGAQPNGMAKSIVLWLMHTLGLRLAARNVIKHMPADCRREIIWRDIFIRGARLNRAERKHFLPGLQTLLDADNRLDGIDTVVLTGTSPRGMTDRYRPALVQAHRNTANVLDGGELVEAPKSGHFILMSDPGIIIEQVLKLVEKHRTS